MDNHELFNVAEITVSYSLQVKMKDRPQIRSSKDAYSIFSTHWSENIEYVEEFVILLLNRSNRVLGLSRISTSEADLTLTKKLRKAGEFLDIQILDHLIITRHEYYSMADEGVM